jgi:fatty-acyl-CoA synthase
MAVAFVIPSPGAALSAQAMQAELRMRIARFKVPERIWFLDAFPVTQSANGEKIKRADLRAMAEARLAAEKEGAE